MSMTSIHHEKHTLKVKMDQDEASESSVLEFLMMVGKLKHLKRTGWVRNNIPDCETVAGHMYRMGIMAFLLGDGSSGSLNKDKCIKMALVHDLAECIVGDLTPFCGVCPEEKHKREMEAIQRLGSLVGRKMGQEFIDLFHEYEEQSTLEAKAVKDLDKFDMILQAFEYEKQANEQSLNLQEFFNSTEGVFEHSTVLKWVEELKLIRSRSTGSQLSKPNTLSH